MLIEQFHGEYIVIGIQAVNTAGSELAHVHSIAGLSVGRAARLGCPPARPIHPIDLRARPIRVKWTLTDAHGKFGGSNRRQRTSVGSHLRLPSST
jgi:hypothetical protein